MLAGLRVVLALVLVVAMALATTACGGEPSPAPQAPPGAQAKTGGVWAVGDGPDGGSDTEAVARMIAQKRPDRVLFLGDVYEHGTANEYRRNYAGTWGKLAPLTSPTPGNHEWGNRDQGYDPYWSARGLDVDPHYYSFSMSGWQILSLNSEGDPTEGSNQVEWLRGQLRAPGTCRLAFWHSSRYSAGENHGDDDEVDPLWDSLAGHASLVVTAHDHGMQRLRPRDGITAFVSGAGGHSHYEIDRDYPGLAFANETDYGALRLGLRPGRADFAFVDTDGRVLDSGTVPCRR